MQSYSTNIQWESANNKKVNTNAFELFVHLLIRSDFYGSVGDQIRCIYLAEGLEEFHSW